jgi:glutamate racemase
MLAKNRPIGIFDSGIGGLTVAREIIKELPAEDIIYFGDTARLPYGNKSAQSIIRFSTENVEFLLKFGVKLIIIACNTSSSLALSALRRRFKVPILDVIAPAVKKAVQGSRSGRIGIIATRATVASRCYQRRIERIQPGFKSFAQACPLFVPLAEEGWINNQATLKIARSYLRPLLKNNIDTLILGCTHYPLLKDTLRKAVGSDIEFVDSAKEIASQARQRLSKFGLCAGGLRAGSPNRRDKPALAKCRFYVSDAADRFRDTGSRFLGKKIVHVKKVSR